MAKNNNHEYQFVGAYYEWHFIDTTTGEVLLVMNDPSDDLYISEDQDGNTLDEPEPMDYDQVLALCEGHIETAEANYNGGEDEFEGISEALFRKLPDNAAEIMAKALYEYYLQ